ncbi:MAG: glycosyltransferase [Bacteroidetes bacterium]|nr:glycosyltransferase [Bacteroidota bacterium]
MVKKNTILVAALHWGLGHATRCIPIIRELLKCNYNVIIASDGAALLLLQKEFPKLNSIELPSYNITYPLHGKNFKWKLFSKIPNIKKVIASEKRIIDKLVSEEKIQGLISDNRFGVRNNKVPSVYLTHQLNVLTGSTTFFSSKKHQSIIRKFDECWVPDLKGPLNFSGKLGHLKHSELNIKYIGPLSRMKKINLTIKYDVFILLSGPEPQRSLFENILINSLRGEKLSVILVQGLVETEQKKHQIDNLTIYNYMESEEIEKTINTSEIVISRSGYTTIMDLAALEKKVFFIPTPGQYEQEYLAKRLKKLDLVPYCDQEDFNIEKLDKINRYKGLNSLSNNTDFKELFHLFEGE